MEHAKQTVYRMAVKWHHKSVWEWVGPVYTSREAFDGAWNKDHTPVDEGRFLFCAANPQPGQSPDDPDLWTWHAEHMTTLSGVPQA